MGENVAGQGVWGAGEVLHPADMEGQANA